MEVPKTIEGLRDALFDEINLLRADKTTTQKARALAQMAREIIDSVRVQIQYARLLKSDKSIKELQLGTEAFDK